MVSYSAMPLLSLDSRPFLNDKALLFPEKLDSDIVPLLSLCYTARAYKHSFTLRGDRAQAWEMQDHSRLAIILLSDCSARDQVAAPTWERTNGAGKNMPYSKS